MLDDEGFKQVVYKKKSSRPTSSDRGGFSSPAERFINASSMQVFKVPSEHEGLIRDNRSDILNRLRAQVAEDQGDEVVSVAAQCRTITLLDTFASLLVSQREKEVLAVTLSRVFDNHYVFWIAASELENRLEDAKSHMKDLWAILRRFRASIPAARRHQTTSDEADVEFDPASNIYNACYTFSRERLKKHYDKPRGKEMYFALVNARDDAKELHLKDEELAFIRELIELFRLYEIYEARHPDPVEAQTNAFNMIRQCSVVNNARHNLEDSSVSFLKRLLSLCDDDPFDGTLYERLLDKMLALNSNIERLLLLSEFDFMSRILNEGVTLEVRTMDEATVSLLYNFAKDEVLQNCMKDELPLLFDDFISKIKPLKDSINHRVIRKDRANVHVHAKCVLLAYLDKTKTRAFNYIDISKLCCIDCWFFFQAYNSLKLNLVVPRYYVRGTHFRQYPWVASSENDMTHRDATLKAMEPFVKDFFRDLLPKSFFVKQRSFSESSVGSFIEHKLNRDWDDIITRAKRLRTVPAPDR